MEKLNRLSIENSLHAKDTQNSSDLQNTIEVDTVNGTCYDPLPAEVSNTSSSRLTENSEALERDRFSDRSHLRSRLKSCSTIDSTTTLRGASTLALKSNISKSLNSSPVNRGTNFETTIAEKAGNVDISKYVPNRISQFNIKNRKTQSSWDINALNNADVNVSREESGRNRCSNTNDTLANKNHVQLTNLRTAQVSNTEFLPTESNLLERHVAVASGVSQLKNSQDDVALQSRSSSNILQKSASCSANSSPVKLKNRLISSARSLNTGSADHLDKGSISKKFANKTASIKELPLLSLFGQTSVLSALRGKSSSMINLNSKQNLKTLLDNSHQYTSNIQAISAERLANVRHKLVNDCPKTGDVKK